MELLWRSYPTCTVGNACNSIIDLWRVDCRRSGDGPRHDLGRKARTERPSSLSRTRRISSRRLPVQPGARGVPRGHCDGRGRGPGVWRGLNRRSLVILDIMLPTMDGIQVCRILRSESGVPILDAHRQGRGARQGAGVGDGGRRLHDQAVQHEGACRAGQGDAPASRVWVPHRPMVERAGGVITSGDLTIDVEARKGTRSAGFPSS